MPKYEIHQRTVSLVSHFNKAWEFLNKKGEITLQTEKNRIPFIVKASVPKRGKHGEEGSKKQYFFSMQKPYSTSAYVFKCCWVIIRIATGEGTRIGMYCRSIGQLHNFFVVST